MRSPARSLGLLSLLLAAVCLAGTVPQTSRAQNASFDPENPVRSLATAHLESDADRVALATSLIEARADTKISFATYRTGVRFFQQNHPEFYGAFFGDPFYADYDVRYQRLTDERRRANLDVNVDPFAILFNIDWLFCNPYAYDPAFNGQCRGFTFMADDFVVLPSFAFFSRSSRPKRGLASLRPHAHRHVPHVSPRQADGPNEDKSEEGDETKPSEDESSGIMPPPTTNPPTRIDPKIGAEAHATTTSLKRPLQIKRLSDRDVLKLTEPIRETLSPQEKYQLVRELSRGGSASHSSSSVVHGAAPPSSFPSRAARSFSSEDVHRLSRSLQEHLSRASADRAVDARARTDAVKLRRHIMDRTSEGRIVSSGNRSPRFERSSRPTSSRSATRSSSKESSGSGNKKIDSGD